MLGRWGGEECLAILPDTDADAALILAERLRITIAAAEIQLPAGTVATVTASIGFSSSIDGGADERVGLADKALYAAKAGGRNRVEDSRGQLAVTG